MFRWPKTQEGTEPGRQSNRTKRSEGVRNTGKHEERKRNKAGKALQVRHFIVRDRGFEGGDGVLWGKVRNRTKAKKDCDKNPDKKATKSSNGPVKWYMLIGSAKFVCREFSNLQVIHPPRL